MRTHKEGTMSARLTVVLEDEELYRRLKVRAAEDGVTMKDLIEQGLRLVLGPERERVGAGKAFDWDEYEAMLERLRAEDETCGSGEAAPDDLSDIKRHLYGWSEQRGGARQAAEERAEYDAP